MALACLTTCSTDSDEPANTPAGISIKLYQSRSDYGSHELNIQIVNGSDDELDVDRATLDSSQFTEPAVWQDGTRIPAGLTVDLPVQLPDARCDAGAVATDNAVTLEFDAGNRGPFRQTYDAKELYGAISGLAKADCTQRAVQSVADVRLGDQLTIRGTGRDSVAELPILIRPTGGDDRFTLDSVEATYLLGPPDQTEQWTLGLDVDATSAPSRATIQIVPARCDPHVLADNSQGTEMTAWFSLDGGQHTDYVLGTSNRLAGQLTQFVAFHCGLGRYAR